MSDRWKAQLAQRLVEPVAIVGIGNPDSGDDGVGPEVVRLLKGRTRAALFDCGGVPENFIGPIARARPKTVVLVDAVPIPSGAPAPGTVALYALSSLREATFHTHAASPALFLDVLVERTRAECFMIGIQPKAVALGVAMSGEAAAAARDVADVIAAALPAVR
jgi:hydrogenase maturation protease